MVALSVEEVKEKGFLDALAPLGNQRRPSYLSVLMAPDPKENKLPSGPRTSPLCSTVIWKNRTLLFGLQSVKKCPVHLSSHQDPYFFLIVPFCPVHSGFHT